ncbi:MAG: fibronectin type III domain-containing protein [Bacteroidia bacterium]|nr:fibronectin type III domain-containing protein [Bacteroidia bacterium]
MKNKTTYKPLIILLSVLFSFYLGNLNYISAQGTTQVIGEVPGISGGFEDMTADPVVDATPFEAQKTLWTKYNTSGTATYNATSGRSGPKYLTIGATAATRFQSSTTGATIQIAADPLSYVVQYYYKATAANTLETYFKANGSATLPTAPDYVSSSLSNTAGVWTKVTGSSETGSSNTDAYDHIVLRFGAATTGNIDIDDICIYQGTIADVTAPDPPTSPTAGTVTHQSITLSWTEPGTGVDGGGYVVVYGTSDPSTTPNTNGIYAVNNSIGSATVGYIGTATSTTISNLCSNTDYWFRIYTVDKAFNYSSAATLGPITTSTQTSGVISGLDGGFHNTTAGTLTNDNTAFSSSKTQWTSYNTPTTATVTATGGRSSPYYATFGTGASDRRLRSPTTADIGQNTKYTFQFYYKNAGNTDNLQVYLQPTGSTTLGTYSCNAVNISAPNSGGIWTKVAATIHSRNIAPDAYGHFVFNSNGDLTTNIDLDDLCVYNGSVDNTAPDPPTNAIVDVETYQSLYIQWSAPATGVDGGGYLIVYGLSDPTTAPNVNGIYKEGNTVAAGETVGYVGTNTYATITGLTTNTTYYFRIYTYDKAFNYSATALTCNGTTKILTGDADCASGNCDYSFVGSNTNCFAIGDGYQDFDDPDCWDYWNGSIWVQASTVGVPTSTNNVYIEYGDNTEYYSGFTFNVKNFIMTSGANFRWENNSARSLTINGDFENAGTLDVLTTGLGLSTTKDHNWIIKGNFTNYGTVTIGRDEDGSASTTNDGQRVPIELQGATNTTFPGPGTLYLMWDLIINKTNATNTVTLDADVTMKQYYYSTGYSSTLTTSETALQGELYLTNGKLILGDYDITLENTVTINQNAVPVTNSFIVTNGTNNSTAGKVILNNRVTATNHNIPIGPATTDYNPLTFNYTGTVDNFSYRVEAGIDPGISNTSDFVNRTWFISEDVATGTDASITFQWNLAHENSTFDRTTLNVYHHNGSEWQDFTTIANSSLTGSAGGTDPYTYTEISISSFSPFIIGDAVPSPLPIELLSFTGHCNLPSPDGEGQGVKLQWLTASETNNDYFTVERCIELESTDIACNVSIGTVNGAGNSNTIKYYEFIDNSPSLWEGAGGWAYYRLKQTDFDGKYSYSEAIAVSCSENNNSNIEIVYISPDIANNIIHLTISSLQDTKIVLKMNNILGQNIVQRQYILKEGLNEINLNTGSFTPGVYFLVIGDVALNNRISRKIIITK